MKAREPGLHSVNPYVRCRDAAAVIAFLERAFGATIQERLFDGDRVSHAQVLIGDSAVMLGQPSDLAHVTTSILYLYVDDCDAAFERALAAGGTAFVEPQLKYYGDRQAAVTDPSGNQWWVATRVETLTPDERERRHAAELARKGRA